MTSRFYLWKHFENMAPPCDVLQFKLFDFYLFYRFMHNGYDKNGLKDWVERLTGVEVSKNLQKTKWFEEPLNENIQNYLVQDVFILGSLLEYFKK